jgi:hypothetical protein
MHLRNHGGSFEQVKDAAYLKLPARKIGFAKINPDPWLDLIVLTGGEPSIWFNSGGNTFPTKNVSVPTQQGWAFAACNIDDDADVGIFVAQSKNPPESALQRQDFALLNNGSGQRFTRSNVPPVTDRGNADWVTCFPNHPNTGFAMVHVTNGRWLLSGPDRAHVFKR